MNIKEQVFFHSTSCSVDGIIHTKFKKDIVIDVDIAKSIVNDRKFMFGDKPRPILVDVSDLLSIDKSAREYFNTNDSWEFITACAVYTTNPLLYILGNAWLMLDKPIIPSKIFRNKQSAITWLKKVT